MVKLKWSPKNHELYINVAKNGQFRFFRGKQQIPRRGKRRISRRSVKIRVPGNTACDSNRRLTGV